MRKREFIYKDLKQFLNYIADHIGEKTTEYWWREACELLLEVEQLEKEDCKPIVEEFFKSRGCCPECGEGYDNDPSWLYNTVCELCGHPIPEHLIIKRNETDSK